MKSGQLKPCSSLCAACSGIVSSAEKVRCYADCSLRFLPLKLRRSQCVSGWGPPFVHTKWRCSRTSDCRTFCGQKRTASSCAVKGVAFTVTRDAYISGDYDWLFFRIIVRDFLEICFHSLKCLSWSFWKDKFNNLSNLLICFSFQTECDLQSFFIKFSLFISRRKDSKILFVF